MAWFEVAGFGQEVWCGTENVSGCGVLSGVGVMGIFDGLWVSYWGGFGELDHKSVWRTCMDLGAYWAEERNNVDDEFDVFLVGSNASDLDVTDAAGRRVVDEATFLEAAGLVHWSLDARLEALREVLEGEPSAQAWEAMCVVFDGWPWEGHGLDVAVEYAMERLRHWPETLRVLPERWARADEWGEHDPRWDLVCVCELAEGAGCLVNAVNEAFFEPVEATPAVGALKREDLRGRRLVEQDRGLVVVDARGDVLACAPPEVGATTVGFSSCERYVWALDRKHDQSTIWLLDAQSLEVVDRRGLEHESAPYYWKDFGFEPITVSPDGRQIAVYSSIGDSIGITCVFWQDNGQIELVPLEVTDREPGEAIGFASDGSRVLFLSCYKVLSVFELPSGRRLWTGGALNSEDLHYRYSLSFVYDETSKGNCSVGPDVILVPVADDCQDPWGVSVHDAQSGQPLGSIGAYPLGASIASAVLSPRFCRGQHGNIMRYLPALSLLRRSSAPAEPL